MRNLLLFAALFFASIANAQNVVTVTAEMGSSFANGAIVAQQIVPGGNGSPSLAFFFNSSGNMVAGLPSNGTWMFRFCNTSNICFNAQVQLPGVLTQDVTTTFTAATTSGGIAAALVSPNDNIIHVSGNCSTQTNCFQTNANTQQDNVATWSTSNSNITIAGTGNAFCNAGSVPCAAGKPTSVGMVAWGTTQCRSDSSSVIQFPYGTITSVTSATQAVMSTTPTANATASGCFTWGNIDDNALVAAENAAGTASTCPSIILSAGMYLIQNQHFKTQPPACARIPNVQSSSNLGGFGFAFGGVGEGATRIVVSPIFTANSTILGNASVSMNGMWLHDFALDCGGDYTMSEMNTNNAAGLVNLGIYSKMSNVSLASCGANNSHTVGVGFQTPTHVSYVTVDSFGGTCLRNNASPANIYADHSAFQDCQATYNAEFPLYTGTVVDLVGGGFYSVGGNVFMAGLVSTGLINLSGTLPVLSLQASDQLYDNGSTFQIVGINNTVAAGNVFLNGTSISLPNASTTGSTPVQNAGSVVSGNNTFFNAPVGGNTAAFVNQSGGGFYDLGANSFTGGSGKFSNSGAVRGSASIYGALATGNVAISACGTSTASGFSGGSVRGQFTITFAGTAVTTCTSTITFPFPGGFFAAPLCQVSAVGGTNPAFPANITIGTLNATTLAFTENFTAAWTAGDTSIVNYSCSNP